MAEESVSNIIDLLWENMNYILDPEIVFYTLARDLLLTFMAKSIKNA